jgi:hypothetical protein
MGPTMQSGVGSCFSLVALHVEFFHSSSVCFFFEKMTHQKVWVHLTLQKVVGTQKYAKTSILVWQR